MATITAFVLAAFVSYAGFWYVGAIEGNFPLLMFMATLVTGIYWVAEKLYFLPQRKVTANNYDDTNPDIRDGIVTWQGYKDNWDAEIFAWDMTNDPVQVTDNEEEDRDPRTAGGRIVWQQDTGTKSSIYLATPK